MNDLRTNMCGDLTIEDAGKDVCLFGWVQRRRDLGNLIFIWLRDRTGIVQVVFDSSKNAQAFDLAQRIRSEYVLKVTGRVSKRDAQNINSDLKTGEVEIIASSLVIINEAETPPFAIGDTNVSIPLRLKYRYLDLRRNEMQQALMLKHRVSMAAREFLDIEGFVDIETPILTKSTPEGARDYLVPSRVHPGSFYALPQSPQLFKQLLMVAGFDRYYQIAKCFRDEDLRYDRQPEFTQIDIEMSFVDVDDVIAVNERLIKYVFQKALGMELQTPFRRITYHEAMQKYGSDKPDLRFGLEIMDISGIVANSGFKAFSGAVENGGIVCAVNVKNASGAYSRKDIDKLEETAKTYGAKGLAWIKLNADGVQSPIAKFLGDEEMHNILAKLGAEPDDLVFIIADEWEIALNAMGQVRLSIADKLELRRKSFEFLWVVDFPLLELDADEKRYKAKHHPFCSPVDAHIGLLKTDPSRVNAKAYDIVLSGTEIGGGSIRIHDSKVQSLVFGALGFSQEEAYEKFGFLLDALKYGTPPHGGIAYGLDRLVMLMGGYESIRDTIAFPKVQSASCLMTEAPGAVSAVQLDELSIAVTRVEERAE